MEWLFILVCSMTSFCLAAVSGISHEVGDMESKKLSASAALVFMAMAVWLAYQAGLHDG